MVGSRRLAGEGRSVGGGDTDAAGDTRADITYAVKMDGPIFGLRTSRREERKAVFLWMDHGRKSKKEPKAKQRAKPRLVVVFFWTAHGTCPLFAGWHV